MTAASDGRRRERPDARREATAWALRCPAGFGSADILTIHPMTEASDLPPAIMKIIVEAAPTWSAVFRMLR